MVHNDLSWADEVNYTVQKTCSALHVIMHILKKGNTNTKILAYTSLVHPIFEYGTACWDPYREGQINALGRVQKKAGKFANHTSHSVWETLAQSKKIPRICSLFRAHCGERA